MSHGRMIAGVRTAANRLVLLFGVIACSGSPRTPDTIVIASGTDLEGMQPLTTVHSLSRQVQRYLVFTPLVRLDARLAPEPWAAQSWHWSADQKLLSFVIDTALRWHDGVRVTAADMQFTLQLAQQPASGYARSNELSAIVAVDAVAVDTLVLQFNSAQAGVPLVLAELPVLPRHRLQDAPPTSLRANAFTFAPVGSGPYRVRTREVGRRWILERVPAFPARMGGVAATKTLVIAVVDEATTKVAGLVSGALDIAGVNPATATLVQRDPTLRVLDYPTFFTNWLVFNPRCTAMQDVRVRRAIAISINRARIVAAGVGGFGVASAAFTADLVDATSSTADTAAADVLLNDAGWTRNSSPFRSRGGVTLRLDMLTVGSGDNPVEQLLQADLRARGIDLRIATRDMGALLSAARSTSAQHCAIYSGVQGDPSRSQLAALFDPSAIGGALDLGAPRPANLGAAFAALRAATDTAARSASWRRVFTILTDSVPAIAIFHSRGVQGVSKRLQHVTIDLRGELFSAAQWTLSDAPQP